MIIRRVVGESMLPTLKSGQLVIGSTRLNKIRTNQLVIVKYNGKEIIKRLKKITKDRVYVIGDNANSSNDSRKFGWLAKSDLLATVIWPKT